MSKDRKIVDIKFRTFPIGAGAVQNYEEMLRENFADGWELYQVNPVQFSLTGEGIGGTGVFYTFVTLVKYASE